MGIRNSAADLSDLEIANFLAAVMALKAKPAPGQNDITVYDQFAALHGAGHTRLWVRRENRGSRA